jgi:hypothetical protein
LELRNQNAKASTAIEVGTMIASMMMTESIRIVCCAAAIGPFGSKMFMRSSGVQPRSQPMLGREVPAPRQPLSG